MMPSASAQSLTVQKLILVDKNGKERAELGVIPGGSGLTLLDGTGKQRGAFIITDDGRPGLALYDQSGVARATIELSNNGESGLALYDGSGRNRLSAIVRADGAAGVFLVDQNGKQVSLTPATPPRSESKPRR